MRADAEPVDVNLTCAPSYTIAYCTLAYGESVLVERGGMAAMSAGLEVSAGLGSGGVAKAAMRKAFGGESFFMGRYKAAVHGAWVAVAPPYPGDIMVLDLHGHGDGMRLESGALLAASEDVDINVKYAGLGSIVLREGATMLHVGGHGKVLVSSYGGIQQFNLREGESIVLDTGHLVGFSDTVRMQVGPLSGITTSAITGEGLVAHLTGPGLVLMQTRAEQGIVDWLMPRRAQNTGNR